MVALAARHNLAELEVEAGGTRIRVVRERAAAVVVRPGDAVPARDETRSIPSDLVTIEAPMVGTFYRAPAPDVAPFVNEGDIVKEAQVLCIIEAMKLMNEIDSEHDGEIASIYVENGQAVQYGERLFAVRLRR